MSLIIIIEIYIILGFPDGSHRWLRKESACNAGDLGLIPGSGRPPGEGNSNPLQHSCLENPMNWGDWQATVHWVTKSQTLYYILHYIYIYIYIIIII